MSAGSVAEPVDNSDPVPERLHTLAMTPDQPSTYAPPYPFPDVSGPKGLRRPPPTATASAVLGIVTGVATAVVCLVFFGMTFSGYGEPMWTVMIVGGAPCAVGTVTGGILVLTGHRRGLLLGSASAAVAVLLVALVVGLVAADGGMNVVGTVGLALPLPAVTAALAAQRSVKGWTEDPWRG